MNTNVLDRDIPWAEYTGDSAPFTLKGKPIYCAWHAKHALFAAELAPGVCIAVCGTTQINGSTLESTQAAAWKFAENNLGGTVRSRAHILNFQKR